MEQSACLHPPLLYSLIRKQPHNEVIMEKLWFYTLNGTTEKIGPVPENEIRALIAGGQIKPADLLWTDGMAEWSALDRIPEFQPASAAVPVSRGNPIPDGLEGWMTFVAVMSIVGGLFYCLGCVGIVIGVFMIIAGVALLAAKNSLAGVTSVDPALGLFFKKLNSFMKMSGIAYIITIVVTILFIIFYFVAFAAMFAKFQHIQ